MRKTESQAKQQTGDPVFADHGFLPLHHCSATPAQGEPRRAEHKVGLPVIHVLHIYSMPKGGVAKPLFRLNSCLLTRYLEGIGICMIGEEVSTASTNRGKPIWSHLRNGDTELGRECYCSLLAVFADLLQEQSKVL
jgi:hypothetical protein